MSNVLVFVRENLGIDKTMDFEAQVKDGVTDVHVAAVIA